MATVSREPIAPQHEKITVRITKEDYLPNFEKSLKQHAKQVNVPGFRKGMVPAGMVRKMYGQSVFNDEVMRTASQQLEGYLRNEQLPLLGQPMILPNKEPLRLSMTNPQDVELNFEIGIRPEVSINALNHSRSLTRYKIDVSDKLIDDEIERITRRFGKVESEETVTHPENVIYTSVVATYETGAPLPGAEKAETAIVLGKLPEQLQPQLMDRKAGDSMLIKPVDVCTAGELPVFMKEVVKADIANAGNFFELTITKVGLLIPHELNGELMLQVFPNEAITEEAPFREKLREELQREFDRIANERLNNEIFETLVHETPMHLPADFLKRQLREGEEKRRSAAQAEHDYPGYEHGLRWQLITEQLMRSHPELQVSREEIKQHVKAQVLGYFGMTAEDEAEGEAPWLDGYVDKMIREEKTMKETYSRLVTDKLFFFLQSQFKISAQGISEEDFFKLPHSHHH